MVNALAITSITNFVLASEVFFLAGMLAQKPKARFSAAWFWTGMMILLGLATLIGGIDHGFFEGPGLPRYFIQRLTWIVLGAMTFFLLMTIATQFFSRQVQRLLLIFGIILFTADTIAVLLIDSFLIVILDYTPVMLLLLVMSLIGLKNNPGSRCMIAGILILIMASAIQGLGMDIFNPVDRNGVYHLVSMVGIVFMYLGGQHFRNAL
jgi:hypothetical protein